jgi:hypothetical protein
MRRSRSSSSERPLAQLVTRQLAHVPRCPRRTSRPGEVPLPPAVVREPSAAADMRRQVCFVRWKSCRVRQAMMRVVSWDGYARGDGSSVGPSELLMLALNKRQCESYVLASGNNSCVLCSPATYWKLLLVLDRPSVLRGSLPYSRSVWYDKMIVDFLSRK